MLGSDLFNNPPMTPWVQYLNKYTQLLHLYWVAVESSLFTVDLCCVCSNVVSPQLLLMSVFLQGDTPPPRSDVSFFHNRLLVHTSFTASLTFLGLGRMAPDEVHTAVRRCVTVLPGPLEEVGGAVRAFVRADSRARRPRADAMFPAFDAAAVRKTEAILGVRGGNSAALRRRNNTPSDRLEFLCFLYTVL